MAAASGGLAARRPGHIAGPRPGRHLGADDAPLRRRHVHRRARVLEPNRPRQRVLRTLLRAALRRVRRVRHAGHVLLFLLLRARGAPHVPAHRSVGEQLRLRQLHTHQGVRRDEARPLPGRGQRARLGRDHGHLRRGRPGDVRHPGAGGRGPLPQLPEALLPRSSPSASASWPACGPSTHGLRTATWRRPPR